MKHQHNADANVNVSHRIPVEDLERVIDKVTQSAATIIVIFVTGQVIKHYATK